MNNAIIDLQTKLSFQDELLEQLNQVITDQQQQISRLEVRLEALKSQVQTMQSAQVVSDSNEPPPHY